jgi:hypothetical protein
MVMALLGLVALAVDVGYVFLVRTQLQAAADSAAMAGAAKLIESETDVASTAQQYANRNTAGGRYVDLGANDVDLGTWDFHTRIFDTAGWRTNAIQVTTRRDATSGGEATLFFARVFGIDSLAVSAEATAALVNNFDGFRAPPSGENLPFLPLAIDEQTCDAMLAGNGSDEWTWDRESEQVRFGSDDVPEVRLFPETTGAPGNFGTVDIGANNNSTRDLGRQILEGLSSEDLAPHGGSLSLDEHGVLELNGDPGISAGIKDELATILGEPRIIPVYEEVTGQGNNACFKIVRFVGVRIMEVELTGNTANKRVMIQPAPVIVRGGIPSSESEPRSHWVFSPVYLVR